jgi:signal transduction histidine kinase/CheY-like chemotaxis protein
MRSGLSNWLIAASVKQAVLEAPLKNALYTLMTFGGIALLIASLIALWLWRFIARPLNGLAIASRQIGTLRGPVPVRTSLREFIAVRDALSFADAQVRSHSDLLEAKVDQRTHELAQANTALTAQMAAREKVESQLRQTQKMEAVGQLTGGIAHDFNNMLSIIISSLNLLQRRIERGDGNIQRFVDSAMEGAHRAATLTSRLLAFSRLQPLAPQILDANRLVADMSELLKRTLGEAIKIETVLAAGLWKIHADAAQIENAILNLAVNARDAMPEGGRLTIESANAFLDEKYTVSLDGVMPGQYVQIAVTDIGVGMAQNTLDHAFDPFFTTKKLGMGTGLGLSQVYGFVKQSHGHIKIYSEPSHGTTIKIYLPRYYGDEQGETPRVETPALVTGSPHEVILVVEDEDKLRHLTVDALRDLGYTVLEASRAAEALDLIDKHPEINLLFTDIVMPEVSGRKLADEALKRRPDLRVLYTTGFTRNAVVHNGILDTGVNFLPKPFSMEDLAAKIRQALSEGSR